MLPEIGENVDERLPYRSRRPQRPTVPAIRPTTPAPKQQSIQLSRETDLQPAHAPKSAFRSIASTIK